MIKMIIDFHMHTDTSSDAKMTIREAYEAAAEKGIKYMCITSHHEPSEVVKGDFRQSLTTEEFEQSRDVIEDLKSDGRVKIFFGVEMSYTEGEEEYIKEFLENHEFDFVLGTLHYVHGWPLGDPHLDGKIDDHTPQAMYAEYFRILKKMIKTCLFDVVAHIDIFKRVLPEPAIADVRAEWEEVGELLAETGIGFEINTSHSRKVPGGHYPDIEIVKIFLEKGVKIITIGSDAHKAQDVGRNIDDVEDVLRGLGVKEIYRFEKRKAIPMPL